MHLPFLKTFATLLVLSLAYTCLGQEIESTTASSNSWIIGLEMGPTQFVFNNKNIDGINPHQSYDKNIILHGIKFHYPLELTETNSKYLSFKLLGGILRGKNSPFEYRSQAHISFLGLHTRHSCPQSKLGFLSSFGLSLVDFSLIEIENSTDDSITYTKGFETAMPTIELGLFYDINPKWVGDMTLIINTKAESRDAYLRQSIGMLLSINYQKT